MADVSSKTVTQRLTLTGVPASAPLNPLLPGMPAQDSIHDDKTTITPTPGGPTYRILKTTEVDAYETTDSAVAFHAALSTKGGATPEAIAAADQLSVAKKKPAPGAGPDDFAGNDRKAAKLSIATGPSKTFADVSDLNNDLPTVDEMVKLNIPTTPDSNRVDQENRNVHITGFLYAASREADNDFHFIVGRDPKTVQASQEVYITMELSGLPPANFPAFGALNAARQAYTKFVGAANLPGAGYHYYQPPIPVQIDGSIFFDATHSKGPRPGPQSLKSRMPTIFEVHPISKITLGP